MYIYSATPVSGQVGGRWKLEREREKWCQYLCTVDHINGQPHVKDTFAIAVTHMVVVVNRISSSRHHS